MQMDKEGATATFFSKIAENVTFPELSELCLTDMKFHLSDFIVFLKDSPLKKLVLRDSSLQNNQSSQLKDFLQSKYLIEGPRVEMQWEDKLTGHGETLSAGDPMGVARFDQARKGDYMRFPIRQVLIWPE